MLRIGYLDEAVPAELPRRPRRGACAHHRVERADRGARYEAHLNEIARNKLDEAATARTCTATKCGKAAPPLQRNVRRGSKARATLPYSQQLLPRAGNWNSCGHTYDVTHTHLAVVSGSIFASKSETMLRAENPPCGRECLDLLLRMKSVCN